MSWKCVGSTQEFIEVVRPEIVANEGEDSYPDVGFHPVSTVPWLAPLAFGLEQKWEEHWWKADRESNCHVAPLVTPLQAYIALVIIAHEIHNAALGQSLFETIRSDG